MWLHVVTADINFLYKLCTSDCIPDLYYKTNKITLNPHTNAIFSELCPVLHNF